MDYVKHLERLQLTRDNIYDYKKVVLDRVNGLVLDVGCGTGRLMKIIKSKCDVKGIDIDSGNVRHCLKEGLDVRKGSVAKIPFRDNSFDFCVCWNLLEHLERDELMNASKELIRVTKRGGRIIVHSPSFNPSFWDTPDHTYPVSEERLNRLFNQAKNIEFINYHIPKLKGLLIGKLSMPALYDTMLKIVPLRGKGMTTAIIEK
ncbi:MAG: class I SAM-dependent methyltransferase [Candidatus Aenigmarchaeota archaeon]|nr:class I SAM-dependent methyltransferase [Candidatus Aenigmarchaeota archaeon]